MSEVVSSRISLDCQLQLSDYLIVDYDLQSYITNRHLICEPTLNFFNRKTRVFANEILYWFHSLYNVINLQKDTLATDHITYLKRNSCSFFKELINNSSIVCFLSHQYLLYFSFHILLTFFIFSKEHFLLNSCHRLFVWILRVKLQTNFKKHCSLDAGRFHEFLEKTLALLSCFGVIYNDFLNLNLFISWQHINLFMSKLRLTYHREAF